MIMAIGARQRMSHHNNGRSVGVIRAVANVHRGDYSDEDEPWDQRQRIQDNNNVAPLDSRQQLRQEQHHHQQQQQMNYHVAPPRARIVDDDGDFDDGDLPSLSTRLVDDPINISASNNSSMQRRLDGSPLGQQPAGPTSMAAPFQRKGLGAIPVTPSPQHTNNTFDRQRKFATRRNSDNVDDDEEEREHNYNGNNNRKHKNTRFVDEDIGPDDEMGEQGFRRSAKKSGRRSRSSSDRYIDDSDESSEEEYEISRSGTFESESHYTERSREPEEEVEDEDEYENTFCGQTLNALGDICGIGPAATSPPKKKGTQTRPVGKEPPGKTQMASSNNLKSPTVETTSKTVLPATSPLSSSSARGNWNPSNLSRRVGEEALQENTVIEVEFMEASKPSSLAPDKKNAYLNALEKKAKEEFERQKKQLEQKSGSAEEKKADSNPLETPIPMQRTFSDGAKSDHSIRSEEDVYNNMTPAEKRKFLKYINAGLSPYDANYKVRTEREAQGDKTIEDKNENDKRQKTGDPKVKAKQTAKSKLLAKAAARGKRFWFGKRSRSHDSEDNSPNKPVAATCDGDMKADSADSESDMSLTHNTAEAQSAVNKSPSNLLQLPSMETPKSMDQQFEKSGDSYYDGARREENDNHSQDRSQEVITPGSTSKKQRQFVFSLSPKIAGFEELNDSASAAGSNIRGDPISQGGISSSPADINLQLSEAPDIASPEDEVLSNVDEILPDETVIESASEEVKAPPKEDARNKLSNPTKTLEGNREDSVDRAAPLLSQDADDKKARYSYDWEERGQRAHPMPLLSRALPTGSKPVNSDEKLLSLIELEPVHTTASETNQYSTEGLEEQEHELLMSGGYDEEYQETCFRGKESASPQTSDAWAIQALIRKDDDADRQKNRTQHFKEETNPHDMSIDDYFSAVADTSPSKPPPYDGMSVHTMGTNITSGSSYTQSSRVRRPGAAKARLAAQKQVESKIGKQNGWHNSIKAVAASTNRVWDPMKGWVDYHDPDADIIHVTSFDSSKEKIHLDLDKSIRSSKGVDDSKVSYSSMDEPSVIVPFPSEWEKERLAMLDTLDDSLPNIARNSAFNENAKSPEVNDAQIKKEPSSFRPSTAESGKPKGWAESMKAASAALAGNGMKWDPAHGWTSTDQQRSSVSDAVDFADDRYVEKDQAARERMKLREYQAHNNFDSVYEDVDKYQKHCVIQEKEDYQSQEDFDEDLAKKIRMIEEKEGFAMVHVSANQSLLADKRNNSVVNDDDSIDERGFNNAAGVFSSSNDVLSTSMVDVVRERVGSEDLELFDDSKSGTKNRISETPRTRVGEFTTTPPKDDPSRSFGSSVDSSFRRGAGPVDVDEIDETWDSDEGDRRRKSLETGARSNLHTSSQSGKSGSMDLDTMEDHIRGWKSKDPSLFAESVFSNDADESRTSASGMGFEVGDYLLPRYTPGDSRSGVSVSTKGSTRSSLSKKVPKLERSKRDTSPISRSRISAETSKCPRSIQTDASKHDDSLQLHEEFLDDEKKEDRIGISPTVNGSSQQSKVALMKTGEMSGVEERKGTSSEHGLAEDTYTYSPERNNRRLVDYVDRSQEDFAVSPSVKDRLHEWETRIEKSEDLDDGHEKDDLQTGKEQREQIGSAEWKSFLNKKVQAESAAAVEQSKYLEDSFVENQVSKKSANGLDNKTLRQHDDDSLFDFPARKESSRAGKAKATSVAALDDISDLSPINHKEDSIDTEQEHTQDESMSDAYGPTLEERGTSSFFQRLSACTAPMMPNNLKAADGIDFLRSIPNSSVGKQASQFLPASLSCGQPDTVEEGEVSLPSYGSEAGESEISRGVSFGDEKPRSKSSPRTTKPTAAGTRGSGSSVVSEDFGAKTAYLEALAMKAAVAKPKRVSTSRRRASGGSSVASGATESSEKWRAFLERKRAAGSSPLERRPNSNSDVSKAAEKYAAEKVEEIMLKMASRSKSAPKSSQYNNELDNMFDTSGEKPESRKIARKKVSPAVKAAEDLAAARVEAMMAALSTNQLDEGEI